MLALFKLTDAQIERAKIAVSAASEKLSAAGPKNRNVFFRGNCLTIVGGLLPDPDSWLRFEGDLLEVEGVKWEVRENGALEIIATIAGYANVSEGDNDNWAKLEVIEVTPSNSKLAWFEPLLMWVLNKGNCCDLRRYVLERVRPNTLCIPAEVAARFQALPDHEWFDQLVKRNLIEVNEESE